MKGNRASIVVALSALGLGITGTASAEEPNDLRPRGTYITVDLDESRLMEPGDPSLGGAPLILYLNRCEGGETISPGNGGSIVNQSTVLAQTLGQQVTMPAFPYGDGSWNQVMDYATAIFSPFNITVTDVDPGNVPHDEALVCGSSGDIGLPPNVGGVAPFSCGVISNPITFTFPEILGNNPRLIAEVVGQEAAHAWGLEHELLCLDPMTYLADCGTKSFQDIDAQCGEYSPRQCDCGGSTQNSYQHIMNTFGASVPDTQAPTAAITYPADGEVFTPGDDFEIRVDVNDDVQVSLVTLYSNDQVAGDDASSPFGPWPVTNIPEGTYDFHIEAEDTAGNVTISPVVTVHVTADGTPPPGDGDGGGDGGEDDGGGDGGGTGGDGGDGDGGDDGRESAGADGDGGALPPDYGFDPDPSAQGCDCTTDDSPRGGIGFGLMLLGLLGLRHSRRRR